MFFFRRLFFYKKKAHRFLSVGAFFLNALASCLEGLSFVLILASFSFLTGESHHLRWFLTFFTALSNPFLYCLLLAIGCQILKSAASYFSQYLITHLTVSFQSAVQLETFKKIFFLNFAQMSEFKKGELLNQITAPATFIPRLFEEYNRLMISALMILTYLMMLFKISMLLTIFIVIFFSVAAGLQKFFFKIITSSSKQHSQQIAELSHQAAQNLDGLKTIHLFHRQKETLHRLQGLLKKIAGSTRQLKKWEALIPSLNESLGVILVGVTLLIGMAILKDGGKLSISALFIYLTVTYRMTTRLQHFMTAKGNILSYAGPVRRLEKILSKKIPESCANQNITSFESEIAFENVSLKYSQKKLYSLKNISLVLPKNQVIALVGISGAGKTSLMDLLMRLYEPNEGVIKIDGQPASHFSIESWCSLFGVVSQDCFVFNSTIEENIRFGCPDATHDAIEQACQMAGADIFIQQLPKGYQTLIGERGLRLSGGERQRIVLAQALVRNPKIILLDEATSHLDSQSEKIIQETLFRLRGEKTFLIVAHRLATIQMADFIYVLEKGKIIESGTHQQLLALGGRYCTFWHLQKLSNKEA